MLLVHVGGADVELRRQLPTIADDKTHLSPGLMLTPDNLNPLSVMITSIVREA